MDPHRSLVVVDAPKVEAKNVPPTLLAVTSPPLYVRMHGRNAATWNVRGGSAAERFDYLYSDDELREFIPPLRELAAQADNAYVLFNNNNRSPAPSGEGFVAQGAEGAEALKRLLAETPAAAR